MTPFRAFRLERLRQPLDVASEIRALRIRCSSLQSAFEVRKRLCVVAFVFHDELIVSCPSLYVQLKTPLSRAAPR